MTTKFRCCVPGCRSSYVRGKENQIHFFKWPNPDRLHSKSIHLKNLTEKRLAAWNSVVRKRLGGFYGRICGKHFVSGQPAKLTSISEIDWIPTLFNDLDYESCNSSMDSLIDEVQDEQQAVDMQCEEDKVEVLWEQSESPISNETVGPENGAIRCLFKVSIRQFNGQRINPEGLPYWLIRAHSIEAFRTYLWELAVPHIKQPVNVETDNSGVVSVSWGDPARITIEQAQHYITFTDRKTRKNYLWKQMSNAALERWHNSGTIFVCIHAYSIAVYSKAVYEIVVDKLLQPKTPKSKIQPRAALPAEADGYSFRDEVRAIRETFLQMRDLMHILDNRITLLEKKCDQAVLQEPMIPMRFESTGSGAADRKPAIGDPLQYVDIKEEYLEQDGF